MDLIPVRKATREAVQQIEDVLLSLPQVEIQPKHYLLNGVYVREITIPAGVMLTGKIHKHQCINIISSGEIEVSTEDGTMKRITAPCTFISPAGTKRIGYAVTDCTWTTIHNVPYAMREIQQLEQHLTADSFEQYEQFRLDSTCTLTLSKESNK